MRGLGAIMRGGRAVTDIFSRKCTGHQRSTSPNTRSIEPITATASASQHHGWRQHQPGDHHRQPDPRSRTAFDRRGHLGVLDARRPATAGARIATPSSGRMSPTTSTSPSGARRARTAPSTWPRAGRWPWMDGCSGASSPTARATSARQLISSLNPCSSSAVVTTLALVTGTGSRAARARPRATFPSIPATSLAPPWVPVPTTTSRSRNDEIPNSS